MQALADNFKVGLPWELFYADDLVLLAESRAELERRLMEWIGRLKEKGLRVNLGKTKVMNCKVGVGQVENSSRFLCGICRKGVGVNSICCGSCKKWIHKRCSGVIGNIEKLVNFTFRNCVVGVMKVIDELKQFVLGNGENVEVVENSAI